MKAAPTITVEFSLTSAIDAQAVLEQEYRKTVDLIGRSGDAWRPDPHWFQARADAINVLSEARQRWIRSGS